MKHGPCKTCMWWWDLYDTGERRCYRNTSPFYHELTVDGCAKHETKMDKYLKIKVDCRMPMRKERKH